MKYNDDGTIKEVKVKSFDTLPVGAEVDYDGSVVPDGWTEIQSNIIENFIGNNTSIDINYPLSERANIICIGGVHNSSNYTFRTYIYNVGRDTLFLAYNSQAGNVNLTITIDNSNNKITITNSGSYGVAFKIIIF